MRAVAYASVSVPRGAGGGGGAAGGILAAGVAAVAAIALIAGAIYAAAMILAAAVMLAVAAVALAVLAAGTTAAVYGLGCGVRTVWDHLDQAAIAGPLQARVEMYRQPDGTTRYRPLPPGPPAPGTDPDQVHIVELPGAPKQLTTAIPLGSATSR